MTRPNLVQFQHYQSSSGRQLIWRYIGHVWLPRGTKLVFERESNGKTIEKLVKPDDNWIETLSLFLPGDEE